MTSHAPLRTIVKDRLRTVRYLAREMKGAFARYVEDQPIAEPLLSMADFSDKAMRRLEGFAYNLITDTPPPFSQTLGLLRSVSEPSARVFAKSAYLALKRIFDSRGIENRAISEGALLEAYWAVASGPSETRSDAELAALFAKAVMGERPVASPAALRVDGEERSQDANLYAACTLSLALLAATLDGTGQAYEDDVLEASSIGVDIMYESFARAAESVGALTELLEALASHVR